MRQVVFPTINASSVELFQNHFVRNYGWPAKEISVPMAVECPCCNKVLAHDLLPIVAVNNCLEEDERDENNRLFSSICNVASIFRCTACNSLFSIWSSHDGKGNEYTICGNIGVYPFSSDISFSEGISALSSDFVRIFQQADVAEKQGLNEICGMGYRRALEFLVDAYIRHIKPNESVDASQNLAAKITDYIDNENIKMLAQKSAWLGNDLTHIENKHPDRTVQDLKKFIRAIVTTIEATLACEDASTITRETR